MPSPLSVGSPSSSPTPSAVSPVCTVSVVSNVALSDGWLFDGNHAWEPIGSPTTKNESQVRVPPAGV